MFVLNSDITIGTFRFSGVNDIKVKRSLYSYKDTAYITLPQKCRIKRKGSIDNFKPISDIIQAGQSVKIDLGYNGLLKTEFEGFVTRVGLEVPTVIECEGYSWKLRSEINVSGSLKATKASELLALAVGGGEIVNGSFKQKSSSSMGINVIVSHDVDLVNVGLNKHNGCDIIDFIKKSSYGALNVFFINPRTLWCGLVFTPFAHSIDPFQIGSVSYRPGYNCLKDNGLKVRIPTEPVEVVVRGMLPNGQRINVNGNISKAIKSARSEQVSSNYLTNGSQAKIMAQEKQTSYNHKGLEGVLTGFLQPFCWPGWVTNIVIDKKNSGKYLVTATEVHFGMNGACRQVEVGAMLGFKTE